MIGKITEESMKLIADDILDAVESTDDREMKINRIKWILEDNGIVEVIPDQGQQAIPSNAANTSRKTLMKNAERRRIWNQVR